VDTRPLALWCCGFHPGRTPRWSATPATRAASLPVGFRPRPGPRRKAPLAPVHPPGPPGTHGPPPPRSPTPSPRHGSWSWRTCAPNGWTSKTVREPPVRKVQGSPVRDEGERPAQRQAPRTLRGWPRSATTRRDR
jgi:hypothetical protein